MVERSKLVQEQPATEPDLPPPVEKSPLLRRIAKRLLLTLPPLRTLYQRLLAAEEAIATLGDELPARDAATESALSTIREHLDAIEIRFTGVEKQAVEARSRLEQAVKSQELEVCGALARRCLFVMGFARSSTTITLEILNTAPNALLLGEANFFQPREAPRWRDWYNTQHVSFRNQATKSAYTPDFVPDRLHTWWEWMEAAAAHYDVLGDKVAFSSNHLAGSGPEAISRFFEARFFGAKYVFLLRNPIDTLLSMAKLAGIDNDVALMCECRAWLRYVQLWADWVRNFPHTLTLIADDFGPQTVADLASFTGLALNDAELLLDERNRRRHEIPAHFPTLGAVKGELIEIFDLAKEALGQNPVLWQAEQKRSADENDDKGDAPGRIAVVPRPLGHAWARAEDLQKRLVACQGRSEIRPVEQHKSRK